MILKQKCTDFRETAATLHIVALKERVQNISNQSDYNFATQLFYNAGFANGVLGFSNGDQLGAFTMSDEVRADIAITAIRKIKKLLMAHAKDKPNEDARVASLIDEVKLWAIKLAQ